MFKKKKKQRKTTVTNKFNIPTYLFILYCTVNWTTAFWFCSSLLNKLSLIPRSLVQSKQFTKECQTTYCKSPPKIHITGTCPANLTLLLNSVQVEAAADGPPPAQTFWNRTVAPDRWAGLSGKLHQLYRNQTASEQRWGDLCPCRLLLPLAEKLRHTNKRKLQSLHRTFFWLKKKTQKQKHLN